MRIFLSRRLICATKANGSNQLTQIVAYVILTAENTEMRSPRKVPSFVVFTGFWSNKSGRLHANIDFPMTDG